MVVLKRLRFEHKVKLRDCLNNGKCFSDIAKNCCINFKISCNTFPFFVGLQVEYYFSDENLPNDKYMLSVIKKNKDGYGECLVYLFT